jgi:glutaredoxin
MSATRDAPARRTRLRPIWLLLVPFALYVGWREFSAVPPAAAVYCNEQAPRAGPEVTMLSARWCRYCTKARNWFVARGVAYCEWDIERSATGAARYAAAPLKGIPQIFVAGRVLVGYDEAELERALDAHDLLPGSRPDEE